MSILRRSERMGILRNIANRFLLGYGRGRDSVSTGSLQARTPAPSLSESVDSLPPTIAGSQKSVETEAARYLLPSFGLLPPFDLSEYLDYYITDSLAKALVDADVNLTVSEFELQSEDDAVNEYLEDFHKRIDIDRVIWEIVRDVSLFGFATYEIIGNAPTLQTSTEVIAVKRIDPRYILIQKNRLGRIEFFRQRPQFSPIGTSLSPLLDIPLDPESVIYVQSLSPLTCYGQSILQSLKLRLGQRNELIDAAVAAHKNHANAVNWLKYLADPNREEVKQEIQEQIAAMKSATDAIDEEGSRWLLSGGSGTYEYTRLGVETLPDAAPLIQALTNEIIVAAGFHPSLFTGEPKSPEASRYTVNSIITRQRNVMSQISAKLYSILPFVESDCPADSGEDIAVQMLPPDETTLKERLEAEAIRINNVGLKVKMGVISLDAGARELGYEKWEDEDKGEQWADAGAGEVNPNDPNSVQQTRASIDSMNKGRSPSNNPSGTKGE